MRQASAFGFVKTGKDCGLPQLLWSKHETRLRTGIDNRETFVLQNGTNDIHAEERRRPALLELGRVSTVYSLCKATVEPALGELQKVGNGLSARIDPRHREDHFRQSDGIFVDSRIIAELLTHIQAGKRCSSVRAVGNCGLLMLS